MLETPVRTLLEKKFGKSIRYPKDCEALAAMIRDETSCSISASTLKRLMGFYKETESPRLYTLDAIAAFLGFNDWADVQFQLGLAAPSSTLGKELLGVIEAGTLIHINYSPSRLLQLRSIQQNQYEVISSNSSNLLPGDIVEIPSLLLHHPLVCTSVIRQNINIGKYIGARNGGIHAILVMEADGQDPL